VSTYSVSLGGCLSTEKNHSYKSHNLLSVFNVLGRVRCLAVDREVVAKYVKQKTFIVKQYVETQAQPS
jgi:hypothetical protein